MDDGERSPDKQNFVENQRQFEQGTVAEDNNKTEMDNTEKSPDKQNFAENQRQFEQGTVAEDNNKTEMDNTEKNPDKQNFAENQRQFEQGTVAEDNNKTEMNDREKSPDKQNFAKKRQIEQGAIAKELDIREEDETSVSSDSENFVKPAVNIIDAIQKPQQRDLEETEIDSRSSCPRKKTMELLTKTKTDIRSKYSDLAIFKSPLCLIKNDENGKLSVEKQVLEEIAKIEETVNVIGIAGPYKTGKSYLLNRLAGVNKGFPLGSTTKASTKGIWVWCLEHPKRQNEVMILLDTEGMGDVVKGDEENDDTILCLTTLLTDTFVLNMFGVLDEKLLKQLSFVANLSEKFVLMNAKPDKNPNIIPDIGSFFPSFVLCLRDFSLEMDDDETFDDYFERCLTIKSGNSKKKQKYNVLRFSIKQHFKNRKCFVFDRPAGRKQLKHLEELPRDELNEDFEDDIKKFLEYMYCREPKKCMDDSRLNGRMFSSLVEQYMQAIHSGEMLCIDEALTEMSRKENQAAVKTTVEIFQKNIGSLGMPLPADFESEYKSMQRCALQMMRKIVVLDDLQEFEREAENEMDELKNKVVLENITFVQEACNRELKTLYDNIIRPKVAAGQYFVQDGYEMYKADFARIRKQVMQSLHTADSNLIKRIAVEFEQRYQHQDENMFLKSDRTEKEIKRKIETQRAVLGLEMSELDDQVKLKRKQDEAELKLFKEDLSAEREQATKDIKSKYEKLMLEWRERELELMEELQKNAESIMWFREKIKSYEKRPEKPTMGQTVMKTLFNLIPIIGPITTGMYERYS